MQDNSRDEVVIEKTVFLTVIKTAKEAQPKCIENKVKTFALILQGRHDCIDKTFGRVLNCCATSISQIFTTCLKLIDQ